MTTTEQLQEVNQQIADLEARRLDLSRQRNAAKEELREKERQLSRELLAGRPVKAMLETIAQERTLTGALDEAIKQADADLEPLAKERAQIEQAISFENYAATIQTVKEKLLTCIRHLDGMKEQLSGIFLDKPRGFPMNDETEIVENMHGQLLELKIPVIVGEFERIAPQFVAEARQAVTKPTKKAKA